jgi:predicted DNA-binding protein YlxM (UPF0122 family)
MKKVLISKNLLKKLYLKDELSMQMIADKLKYSLNTIHLRLIELKIPIRTSQEAMLLRYKGKHIRNKMPNGYIRIHHPITNNRVLEHRLVMEQKIGRPLKSSEVVHHINGIRDDNRVENLCVLSKKHHKPNTLINILQKRIRQLENKLK